MSESSAGPGWWLASDGKWYPPHLHPSVSPVPQPPPSGSQPTGASATGTGVAASGGLPSWGQTASQVDAPNPWGYQSPGVAPPGYVPPGGYPGDSSWASANPNVVVDPVIHLPLAPWWKRLVALIIDGLILGLGYFMLFFVIGIIADLARGHTTPAATTPTTTSSGSFIFLGFIILWLLASVPSAIYYAVMNGSRRGQTVGKMALSIAVRDARTGAKIGFWRAFGRFAITIVFTFVIYIPYLLDSLAPLWDKRRQSWHDKVAHSVVVDLKP